MTINFRNIIHLTTPQYLIIAIISPIASFILINSSFPGFDIMPLIISLMLGILGFNTFNQISDIEMDKIDKPLRPLISKKVSINEAIGLSLFFYLSSIILAFLTNNIFFFLMLIFTVITYGYCSKTIYLKKYFWGSSFVGTIIYGAIPFIASASISQNSFNLIFLIFFSLLFTVISNTKDFEDISGEKRFGINSIPLLMGNRKAAILIVTLEFILIFVMAVFSYINYINFQFIYASILSSLILIIISDLFLKDIKRINYKNIAFLKTNNIEIKNVITQSDAPTISIIFVLLVELIFGLTALTIV